jgi:hypothetical protein
MIMAKRRRHSPEQIVRELMAADRLLAPITPPAPKAGQ